MSRILFYADAFGGGGAEIVFARLAHALAADGHVVTFAADHAEATPSLTENLTFVHLPRDHIGATRALAALLRRGQFDASFSALGSHNLKHVAAAMMAGRLNHCVIGIHGFADAEPKFLSRLSYWMTPLLTRLAALTICVTDVLKADMIQRWHASPNRLVRIYNPVVPRIAQDGVKDEPPLVVACGRLVELKRFADLVRAFSQVTPHDARLAILGAGPERPAIEAAIKEHGLTGRVEMPGHVDPALWYPRASCLAVSSRSESFGLTIAEALAYGLPVVSTDCGGPREILENGRYGRLVPVGDAVAMAEAISAALASPGDPAPRVERADAFFLTTIRDAYAEIAAKASAGTGLRRS